MAGQKNVCLEAGPADSVAHRSTHMFLQAGRHARPVRKTRGPEKNVLAFKPIVTVDPALLLRAIEVYEIERLDFAEAYLVACAETTGINQVASFDQAIDRVSTVERIEPPTPPT